MSIAIDNRAWVSPNHHKREERITALVLHTGEGTRQSDLQTLTKAQADPRKRVSSHYYVCSNRVVYQLVDDREISYHAGISFYRGLSNWNEFSLGVETEHKQGQAWSLSHQDAIADLFRLKIEQYKILQPMIAAHRWIAPDRKLDPTNWPDDELKAWIAQLYKPVNDADERQKEWGSVPVNWDWSIPQRWWVEQQTAAPLGKAETPEVYPSPGFSVQYFQRGSISYRASDGKTSVGRW